MNVSFDTLDLIQKIMMCMIVIKSIPSITGTFSITTISCLDSFILFKFSLKPLFSVQFHWISSRAYIIGL